MKEEVGVDRGVKDAECLQQTNVDKAVKLIQFLAREFLRIYKALHIQLPETGEPPGEPWMHKEPGLQIQ